MQKTRGLPRKGLLVAIGAAMLLGVLYLCTGASLTRAQQRRRGLIESSGGDQSTAIVPSKARPGGRVGTPKEAKCSAVSRRHKTFKPLLDAGLCKRLSSLSQASKYLSCGAPMFALEGTPKQRPIGTACQPNNNYPDVANGTATNLPCRSHACCDAPVTVRKGTRDCGVFQQVFSHHFYKYIYPIAQTFSPKYILDAGGNVGFSTVMFKLLWPEAIVVGLEPDPANFATYQLNTAPFRGVHAVNAGLWGHRTRLAPAQENMQSWGKVFKEVGLDEEGIDAYSVKDIAAMFDIPGFDFVKMDVEGAEGVVFMGNKDLSWLHDVQLMALEVHEGGNSPFGLQEVTPQIFEALSSTGMRGVEDGEHVFFMTQQLQQGVGDALGSA